MAKNTIDTLRHEILQIVIKSKKYMCSVRGSRSAYKFFYGPNYSYSICLNGKKIEIYNDGGMRIKRHNLKRLYEEIRDWPSAINGCWLDKYFRY